MGHDLTLQAVSVPSTLLNRLEEGAFAPELLVFIDYYFEGRRKRNRLWEGFAEGAPERLPFVEAIEEMLAADPDIDRRFCSLGREYSWLHMVLESVKSCDAEGELARWSVLGERQICADATSTQGFRIMWNSPETCRVVHDWLDTLRESEVVDACDVDRLRDRGSYKIQQSSSDTLVVESVLNRFRLLRKFYVAVVGNRNGVLFDKD